LEDLFPVLIVLFLIVGPLIDKLLKAGRRAGQQPQRPPQRRTLPAERQRLPDGRTMTTSRPAEEPQAQEARDASDLLPAELWEILTGQKRQQAPEPPQPPEPQRTEPERPAPPVAGQRKTMAERRAEAEQKRAKRLAAKRGDPEYDEAAAAADLMRRREQAQATRRRFDHSAPEIVSLETEPASEAVRHAAFHDKLDRLPKPHRRPQPVIRGLDLDLDDQAALQHAILLQEVLGRPKGLD
jgi:hypothetical protein